MLTTTPLPSLPDLAAAFFGPAPDDALLGVPWVADRGEAVWFSRSAWALAALVRWWEARTDGPPRVWLPDYFCNQSTAPLRDRGVTPVFYPVTAALEPDWEACEAMTGEGTPDLFVLVHYFGRPADGAAAQDFCRRNGALLIEDAAHALVPAAGIGSWGDFTFYSPWKLLAAPAGAVLVVADRSQAEPVRRAGAELGAAQPSPWPWLAKRAVQVSPLGKAASALRRPAVAGFEEDPPFAPLPQTPVLGRVARRLLARSLPALGETARRRILNEQCLAAGSMPDGFRPFFGPAPETTAPYRFVLSCPNSEAAAAAFDRFRNAGCPVESWPDLAPEVRSAPKVHKEAIKLRDTILLLPVHQSLAPADLAAGCPVGSCLQPPGKPLDTPQPR